MSARAIFPAAVLLLAGCSSHSSEEEKKAEAVVAVKTAAAVRGQVEIDVTAPATVFPIEQARVAARITAPIREMRVHKGDRVARGQTLAVLEDRDLRAQRAEAAAAVTDAQASLEKLSAGTLPTDLERARGQVATAQAALDLARKNYERRKELFDQGAIPQRDLNVSETELAQAKTNLEVAQKALDLLRNQSGEREVRIAQSRLDQARARLQATDAQLAYTVLASPFAGIITEQFAYPGDMAKPDAPLLTIMNLSSVVARAQVPETDAAKLRQGMPCRFAPSDLPGSSATGAVSVVSHTVDDARRTVETWCEIHDPPAWLRAGAFGSASIVAGRDPNAVLIPREAVQFQEGTRNGIVMVVDSKGLAHERAVECGVNADGNVQILKGVKAGEVVITEGGFGLAEGTKVKPTRETPP
jgi:multidrug efflux pump subunit AcrA (membrane-fusion protein)